LIHPELKKGKSYSDLEEHYCTQHYFIEGYKLVNPMCEYFKNIRNAVAVLFTCLAIFIVLNTA